MANAEDIIPKYPIMLIIAIPDLKPASCCSADSSIVSAMKSSFGNDRKKNSFTSNAFDGSLSFTINDPECVKKTYPNYFHDFENITL